MIASAWKLIPLPARILAIVSFVGIPIGCLWFFADMRGFSYLGTSMGLLMGSLLGATILLAGYVYADAKRRGMPPVPWTLIAIFVPNFIGFVLYFLLRKPIMYPCPGCGNGVPEGNAFCPNCGAPQVNGQPQRAA